MLKWKLRFTRVLKKCYHSSLSSLQNWDAISITELLGLSYLLSFAQVFFCYNIILQIRDCGCITANNWSPTIIITFLSLFLAVDLRLIVTNMPCYFIVWGYYYHISTTVSKLVQNKVLVQSNPIYFKGTKVWVHNVWDNK